MEKKDIFPFIYDNLPLKFNLCYFSTINISTEFNIKDPIYNLLQYSDLEHILKFKEGHITKFYYFNRKNLNKVLYDSDNNIHFEYYENNNNLSFYFYLLLLIKDTPDILNFTYDQKYIKKMYNQQNKSNDQYKKIIISKIIIELSNDFKVTNDLSNDENEKNINKIIDKNLDIIQNVIKVFDIKIKLTKEEIYSKKIDEIYIEIINELIIQKKLENSEKIIRELDLQNINLTKTMIDGLFKTLNNKDYIEVYIIINKEDLLNSKKINFYYILLKYILKDSLYIYQIPFLLKTKKNIKNIIKKNNNNIIIEGNDIYDKIKQIVRKFGYSDKYIKIKKEKKINDILLKYCHSSSIGSRLNLKRINSQISLNNSLEQKKEKISFLNVIKFTYNLIFDQSISDNLIKNSFIDKNIEKQIKNQNYSKIEEDKFKEIIANVKFKEIIYNNANDINENINVKLNKLIKEVFYFEVYKEIEPQNANEKSINTFKEWIKKYKLETNEPV